jgi:hypothetical protein
VFEGPLDLLLEIIQKHELDILDIPVGFVTEKYLEYLKLMQSRAIDGASEYLVMAATLTLIKSRMLLPDDPTAAAADRRGAARCGASTSPRLGASPRKCSSSSNTASCTTRCPPAPQPRTWAPRSSRCGFERVR